jgi:hypothetical protein
MPAVEEVHIGDVGTAIILEILEDGAPLEIPADAVKKIWVRKPGGLAAEWDATLVTDGTDGKIQYITEADDLDTVGAWRVQGHVEFGGGKWSSSIGTFQVFANLQ